MLYVLCLLIFGCLLLTYLIARVLTKNQERVLEQSSRQVELLLGSLASSQKDALDRLMARTTAEYQRLSDTGEPPQSFVPLDELWGNEEDIKNDPRTVIMQFEDFEAEIDELSSNG